MSFIDEVRVVSDQFATRVIHLDTKEATKNSLALPFIQLLGYDIFDPTEVVPEFKVDVGSKREERVDYALFQEGEPAILVECNTYGTSHSDEHLSQLLSCLRVTDARFGLLTDGISYGFYSDLDQQDFQESIPFFEINILDYTESQVKKLRQFTKSEFHEEKSVAQVYRQKYFEDIQVRLAQEFTDPSDDLIKLIMKSDFSGSFTQEALNHFRPLIREGFNRIVDDGIGSHSNSEPNFAESSIEPALSEHSTKLINWISISQVSHVTHRDPPTAIKFGQSESQPIDFWWQVLREVTDWLVRTERFSRKDLPINESGDGFTFVNSVSNSPNGSGYIRPRRVSGGVFVETNYNANTLIKNCTKLLDHHSVDLETVKLRFE